MARRRKHDHHLPRHVRLKHGGYYFRDPVSRRETLLSRDLGEALTKYAALISGGWSGRTLGDVIDRYRIEVLPLKGARARGDQGPHLDRLKRVFGHMQPDSITVPQLYRYIDGRRYVRKDKNGKVIEDRPAPSAARHEISLLGHVLAKSIRWGVSVANPVRVLEREPKPKGKRYVTDAEYRKVLKAATPRMKVAIELAYLTGLRRGDVLSLTRADLTEKGIRKATSKTGVVRTFRWTPKLRRVVQRAKALKPQVPSAYLVRTRAGKPYSPTGFAANWKRTLKKAGVQFKFHDLRRKNASDSGSLEEARTRLGHASAAITQSVYRVGEEEVWPLR